VLVLLRTAQFQALTTDSGHQIFESLEQFPQRPSWRQDSTLTDSTAYKQDLQAAHRYSDRLQVETETVSSKGWTNSCKIFMGEWAMCSSMSGRGKSLCLHFFSRRICCSTPHTAAWKAALEDNDTNHKSLAYPLGKYCVLLCPLCPVLCVMTDDHTPLLPTHMCKKCKVSIPFQNMDLRSCTLRTFYV